MAPPPWGQSPSQFSNAWHRVRSGWMWEGRNGGGGEERGKKGEGKEIIWLKGFLRRGRVPAKAKVWTRVGHFRALERAQEGKGTDGGGRYRAGVRWIVRDEVEKEVLGHCICLKYQAKEFRFLLMVSGSHGKTLHRKLTLFKQWLRN